MDRRIFHIQNLLSRSLGRPWTVEEMAKEVSMSASRFRHLFKKEMGFSPIAYLRTRRLDRACELLSDTSCFLQIKEIANQIGMPNESQFTREFKKLTGKSPTEFRENCSQIEQSNPPSAQESSS